MRVSITGDNGDILFTEEFGEEKLSTNGRLNRYAGGKANVNGKRMQISCNATVIKAAVRPVTKETVAQRTARTATKAP